MSFLDALAVDKFIHKLPAFFIDTIDAPHYTCAMRTGRIVLAAFGAALIIKSMLFDIMISEGRSMLPTIRPGTIVLIDRAAYGLRLPFMSAYAIRWRNPVLGDIVVFPSPDGVLAVKRVHEVSEDRFMAIGDNAPESYDSRKYGPVAVDSIVGKVVGIK